MLRIEGIVRACFLFAVTLSDFLDFLHFPSTKNVLQGAGTTDGKHSEPFMDFDTDF